MSTLNNIAKFGLLCFSGALLAKHTIKIPDSVYSFFMGFGSSLTIVGIIKGFLA